MVRTKADRVPAKAVGSKAPQKTAKSTPVKKTIASSKGRSYLGGNPSHPRDTPEWQKPITCFLNQSSLKDPDSSELQEAEGESSSKEAENYSELTENVQQQDC